MLSRYGWEQNYGRTQATFGPRGDGSLYVSVIQKTDYEFALQSGNTATIPLATGIDTSAWVSGAMSIRVHSKTLPSGTSASVSVQNIFLDPNEPDVVIPPAADLVTQAIVPGDLVPLLYTVVIPAPIGPMMRVLLKMNGTGGSPTTIKIALSVDLIGRTA